MRFRFSRKLPSRRALSHDVCACATRVERSMQTSAHKLDTPSFFDSLVRLTPRHRLLTSELGCIVCSLFGLPRSHSTNTDVEQLRLPREITSECS